MLEGRLRRSMVEVHLDNRIRLTALTSPGICPRGFVLFESEMAKGSIMFC
jgi:hypothetical protein